MSDDENNNSTSRDPMDQARKTFKSGIKAGVDTVNAGLALLERASVAVSDPVVKGLHSAQEQTKWIGEEASHLYKTRREVGPWLIGGATVVVGGITTLRRGRLPGIATGTLAGYATYLGVYQLDVDAVQGAVKDRLSELPFGFGKK